MISFYLNENCNNFILKLKSYETWKISQIYYVNDRVEYSGQNISSKLDKVIHQEIFSILLYKK